MNISRLRQETADAHREVEAVMSLMDHNIDLDAYVRCLSRIYGLVAAWEEESCRAAPAWLLECLTLRQRRRLLDTDLAAFGHVPPLDRANLPPLDNVYRMLGAMYVFEGSTLGGQLISRHVEKHLGFKTGVGDAFFLGHGNETGRMWKEFCGLLDTKVPESETEFVVQGANAMFVTFREWMQGIPAPIAS